MLNLDKYVVISGVPGVHKIVASRSNGLVVEDRLQGRTRFIPVRQQQVSPLGTVAVYTDTDEGTVPIARVFEIMLDQLDSRPPVPLDSPSPVLRGYFSDILPEHDHDRVHITDIKKCIKWFNFMLEKGIFKEAAVEEEDPAKEETAETPATEPDVEAAAETPASEPPAELSDDSPAAESEQV